MQEPTDTASESPNGPDRESNEERIARLQRALEVANDCPPLPDVPPGDTVDP